MEEEREHPTELVFACYNTTVLALSKIIIDDKNHHKKSEGLQNLTLIERNAFVLKWHLDNRGGYLQAQMGLGVSNIFLTVILFSMNASLTTVPHLQSFKHMHAMVCNLGNIPCFKRMVMQQIDQCHQLPLQFYSEMR